MITRPLFFCNYFSNTFKIIAYINKKIAERKREIESINKVPIESNCLVDAYLLEMQRQDKEKGVGKHTFEGEFTYDLNAPCTIVFGLYLPLYKNCFIITNRSAAVDDRTWNIFCRYESYLVRVFRIWKQSIDTCSNLAHIQFAQFHNVHFYLRSSKLNTFYNICENSFKNSRIKFM